MRFLILAAAIAGVYYWGHGYVERRMKNDLAALEQRSEGLTQALTQGLSATSQISPEEVLSQLGAFTHPSDKIGGLPSLEFWQNIAASGTIDSVKSDSYKLHSHLFQAGPRFYPISGKPYWKWSSKIGDYFQIGYVDASVSFRGRGIPSEEVMRELIETMRQQGKLDNFVFYHGQPMLVDLDLHWVWSNKNWRLAPEGKALSVAYRPQQRL